MLTGLIRPRAVVVALTFAVGSVVPVAAPAGATADTASGVAGVNSVVAFGDAGTLVAGASGPVSSSPVVGIAATADKKGFWLVTSTGQVLPYGDARFYGSIGKTHLNQPIVGLAATPDGHGYWLVASDGGIFTFGDATFHGSTGNIHLNQPVVGMAATPDGHGYWLVASDGGIFTFGDATFHGSTGNIHLNQPVVGMAATPDGRGYWLVASDGGIFTFGDATFHGSTGNIHLNQPVVGMAATPDGHGYWLVASDGGIFTFGDATFHGSSAGAPDVSPDRAAAGMAASPAGYWVAFGERQSPVPAIAAYAATRRDNITVAVEDLTDGQKYFYRPGVVEHTASTLKVDILATLEARAQSEGRGLTAEEQSLAVPMIEESLDSAADILWSELGPGPVASLEHAVGMTATVPATNGIWGETTTTAADRLAMVRAVVFPNSVLSDSSRAYILYLMEHITPSQDWGATGGVPAGVTVALKNGFAVINGWQINTEAWVDGDGRDYLISVLTDANPTEAYGIQTLNSISSIVWDTLR